MKKMLSFSLAMLMVVSMATYSYAQDTKPTAAKATAAEAKATVLPSGYTKGWHPRTKEALNDFYAMYGKDSKNYDAKKKPYVIFDIDNTTSIFDIQEQASAYMLNHMTFAIAPEKAFEVFMTEVPTNTKVEKDSAYRLDGKNSGLTFEAWAKDAASAYGKLYKNYKITPKGIQDKATLAKLHADPDWKEFSAKMRSMYDVIYANLSPGIAYPWVLFWFTGMTEQEAYDVLYASHKSFGKRDFKWRKETFASPKEYKSLVGPVSYEWTYGITVPEENVQLWKDLKANGFDVYACSASMTDTIRAAVDAFGLSDYVDGVIAMTIKLDKNGKYTNEYDYKTGYSWWNKDGKWVKGTKAIGAQNQGPGKVTAIKNVLVDKYGYGPIAGFMDSTGDFNFSTEFDSLRLVQLMNRLRKATDGGGIIQVVAMKQAADGIDLAKANAAGDVLYTINGRDENGGYLIQEQGVVPLGKEYRVFANDDLKKIYDWYSASDLTVGEFINKFAIVTPANAKGNELKVPFGFLEKYSGYKNIK